jgi:CelD/BcsL family acetyltransferase involved in cellulose biosynthesis
VVAVRLETGQVLGSLEASVVTTEQGFVSLHSEWDSLVDTLDLPSPFHSWDWNYVWWKHFGRRPHIVVFRSLGRLVGLAQLQERRHGWVTSLVPIGWGNLLTEQLEMLFPRAERSRLMAALRSHLLESHLGWVGLSGLEESDLAEGLEGLGVASRVNMPFEYRELPGTWDEMVRGLNRSMRGNVKYYPRLMLRDGFSFEVRFAESAAEVSASLPTLYRLHAARAATQDGVAHKDYLERTDHRAFLDEVAPILAAQGGMKVALLEVEGQVIAAQVWLERGRTMFLYYSGYLPEWSRFSVAMITTSEILKYGIARGLDRVEFLRGTGQFKTRWDTRRRYQLEVTWARQAKMLRVLLDSYRGARQALRRARRAF